jgi:hypothetical protein
MLWADLSEVSARMRGNGDPTLLLPRKESTMAQAAADPFDSLENSPDSLASTDDLLSQMAGKEVDRLLAENEPDPADAPLVPEAPPLQEQSMTAQLDELFSELQSPAAAPAPQKRVDVEPEPSAQGTERAALLEAAGFDGPAAGPPADLEGDSQDPIHEAAPKGPERSALLEAAGFEATNGCVAPASDPPDQTEPVTEDAAPDLTLAPLPIYLKPLAWMNAPLDACPAGLRQILGKAAILTLINALVVLTYVLVIRKH